MKKVIIHVGQYKTGSTSIQKLMWENRNKLLEYEILYPQAFVRDGAHFLITDLLRKEYRNMREHVQLYPLREEIENSSAATAVISCESLSGATVRWFAPDMMKFMWQRLVELFDGFDLRAVFYVRRQDESIDSRIIQEIKGQAKKSDINYEPFLYTKSSLNYYYFYKIIERVFGRGNVDVRLYDRKSFQNDDVRADFLNYLGLLKCDIELPTTESNVAPSAKLVGFYRVINSLNIDSEDYDALNKGLWREFGNSITSKAVVLGSMERKRVMEYFLEANEKFVAECIPVEVRSRFVKALFSAAKDVESNVSIDGVEALRILKTKGYEVARVN